MPIYTPPERDQLIEVIRERCASALEPIPTGEQSRLKTLSSVRAVLFDVYGTLFLSGSGDVGACATDLAVEAFAEALKAGGGNGDLLGAARRGNALLRATIKSDHAAARDSGIDFPEVDIRSVWERIVRALVKEGALRLDPHAKTIDRLVVEHECRVNPVWPAPSATRLLEELRHQGLVLGIVSNAQFYTPLLFDALLQDATDALGFANAYCAWSYAHGIAKPSTQLYRHALDKLEQESGIAPHETVFVGNDMLNDIWTASQVGCQTALFAGDRRSLRWRNDDSRCADLQPDVAITDLGQLLDCLA